MTTGRCGVLRRKMTSHILSPQRKQRGQRGKGREGEKGIRRTQTKQEVT